MNEALSPSKTIIFKAKKTLNTENKQLEHKGLSVHYDTANTIRRPNVGLKLCQRRRG